MFCTRIYRIKISFKLLTEKQINTIFFRNINISTNSLKKNITFIKSTLINWLILNKTTTTNKYKLDQIRIVPKSSSTSAHLKRETGRDNFSGWIRFATWITMNFLRRKQQQFLIEIEDPRHDGLTEARFLFLGLADRLYSSVDAARLHGLHSSRVGSRKKEEKISPSLPSPC